MAIKFTFNMSDNDVAKGIVSIGKRSASIRKDMHSVAVSVLWNWAQSGDVSTACRRASEMLEHSDDAFAQKIVNWFGVHAGFTLVDTDDGKAFGYDADRTTIDADGYQAAKAETMFALTPDTPPQPYDLRAQILNLIQRAENKRTRGLKEGDNGPADLVKGLKSLVADDAS